MKNLWIILFGGLLLAEPAWAEEVKAGEAEPEDAKAETVQTGEAKAEDVKAENVEWPTIHNLKSEDAENIYDRPYTLMENKVDKKMLYRNTGALVGVSVITMGFLYAMPSSFTNWEDNGKSPTAKWWRNVSHAPVWDKDDLFLNYVTHPYAGAIYYMGARSAGVNAPYSFLYSAALSTFFWEYGVEAFAERPSIQDLIVTPVAGAILGEGFYLAKRHIKDNEGKLLGSKIFGKTVEVIMDPMTEFTNWAFENDSDSKPSNVSFTSQPMVSPRHGVGYSLQMKFHF